MIADSAWEDSTRLERMDRVRLGRALGYGARHAAKTLSQAIDAATSPGPSQNAGAASARRSAAQPSQAAPQNNAAQSGSATPRPNVEQRTAETISKLRTTSNQARRASGSLMQPVKRFSKVLWLEVSGTFFALIAVSIALGTWRMRLMLHSMLGEHEALKGTLVVIVFLAFTYFVVSNFVRASRQ